VCTRQKVTVQLVQDRLQQQRSGSKFVLDPQLSQNNLNWARCRISSSLPCPVVELVMIHGGVSSKKAFSFSRKSCMFSSGFLPPFFFFFFLSHLVNTIVTGIYNVPQTEVYRSVS
jgi:hypothetical protein